MTARELICLLVLVSVGFAHFLPNEVSNGRPNQSLVLNAVSSSCKETKDCTTENSECLDGVCQCRKGFVVDGTSTTCLKVATGYNDTCEESVQCSRFLGAGGVCSGRTCACLEGFHYLHGRCHESRGLNEPCENDDECFVNTDYQAASCTKGVCKCSEGYYQREYSTCRPLAKNVGDDCIIDADCAAVGQEATCNSTNQCTTDKKNEDVYIFIEEMVVFNEKASKIGVGSECTEDSDCKLLDNSHCGVDKKCMCNRAHFPSKDLKGCTPEIGEECKSDDVPYKVDSSKCKNGVWTCDIDRVSLKTNQLCRKIILDITGKNALYSEQCQLFGPKAEAVKGFCACAKGTHWLQNERFCWVSRRTDEACTTDNDCEAPTGSLKITCKGQHGAKVCSCPEKTKPSEDKRYCALEKPELNSYCEVDNDCGSGNLVCQTNQCKCNDIYFESEGICLPGINAPCKINKDCKLNNTICSNKNTCQCGENYVAGPERQCIIQSAYQKECQFDVQCTSVVRNSHCFLNKTTPEEFFKTIADDGDDGDEQEGEEEGQDGAGVCECLSDHSYYKGSCFKNKKLGQECTMEGECRLADPEAVCRSGKCECSFNYKQDGRQCKSVNGAPATAHLQPWLVLLTTLAAWKALR